MSASVRSSGTSNRGFSNRSNKSGSYKTNRNQQRKQHSSSSSGNFSSSHSNEPMQGRLEGVYANAHFTYHVTSLMGVLVRVVVTNGNMFEGILRSCSPSADVVLNAVHRLKTNDKGNQLRIDDNLTENMLFHAKDIVHIEARDINVKKYKKLDFMTDSAISGYNGETEGRELTPWEADPNVAQAGEIGLFDDNSTRWDPKDMLHVNETMFGVKSTFDSSMKDYTTELKNADSIEYKRKMVEAERLANEIDSENRNRKDVAFSTLTEEGKYSAVISETNVNKFTESTESQDSRNDTVKVDETNKKESSGDIEVAKDEHAVSDNVDKIVNIATFNAQEEHVDVPENSSNKVSSQSMVDDESIKDETTRDVVSSEKQKISSLGHLPMTDMNKTDSNDGAPAGSDGKSEAIKATQFARLKEFHKSFTYVATTNRNESPTKDATNDDVVTDDNSMKAENLSDKKKSYTLNPNAKEFNPTNISPKSKPSHSPSITSATPSTTSSGIYQTSSSTSSGYQNKHRSKGRSSSSVANQSGSFPNHPGTTFNTQNMSGHNSYTEQPQVQSRFVPVANNAMHGYDPQMQTPYYGSVATVTQPVAMNFPTQVAQPMPTGSQPMSTVIPRAQIVQQTGIRHGTQNQQAYQQVFNPQRYSLQGQQIPQQVASPGYNVIIAQRPLAAGNNTGLTSQFIPSASGQFYQYNQ